MIFNGTAFSTFDWFNWRIVSVFNCTNIVTRYSFCCFHHLDVLSDAHTVASYSWKILIFSFSILNCSIAPDLASCNVHLFIMLSAGWVQENHFATEVSDKVSCRLPWPTRISGKQCQVVWPNFPFAFLYLGAQAIGHRLSPLLNVKYLFWFSGLEIYLTVTVLLEVLAPWPRTQCWWKTIFC